MTQAQLAALLGRSLTPKEVTNVKTYLDIAKEELESLLCISLCGDCNDTDTRVYQTREGMRTVFTDIFSEVSEVKVDGTVVTDYYKAFWDNRNGSFYNSIVFSDIPVGEIEVTADWGFVGMPSDLNRLWAQMFAVVSRKRSVSRIKSKKVEDFSITYDEGTDMDTFVSDNALTIRKYSMCYIGEMRHGKTCTTHGRYECGYCI